MTRLWHNACIFVVACILATGCIVEVPDAEKFAADRCVWRVALEDPARDFTLSAIIPMSKNGKVEEDGLARSQAMELAILDANERNGVTGRKFGFRVCDKQGDWVSRGSNLAGELGYWLGINGVQATITGGSVDTLRVHSKTVGSGVLVMSLGATAADLTNYPDKDLMWRVAPSDVYQGVVMGKLLVDEKAKNVAVLAVNNTYGDSLANVIKKETDNAVKVTTYAMKPGLSNLKTVLDGASKQAPDYVVMVADQDLAVAAYDGFATYPNLKKAKLLLSDALHKQALYKAVKDAKQLQGALGTLPGDPAGKVFDAFKQNFKNRFSADASQRSFTGHSYDATYTVILAHAWALRDNPDKAVTGADLAQGLTKLSDLKGTKYTLEPTSYIDATKDLLAGKSINIEGASGPLDFDSKTGEPTSAVEVWRMKADGTFETLKWIRATKTGDTWSFKSFTL